MPVHHHTLSLDSRTSTEILDITDAVRRTVQSCPVRHGLVQVITRHTTSGIRIGEAEHGLFQDLTEFFATLAPAGKGYRHDRTPVDGRCNAHSHLAAFLLGSSEGIALIDRELQLGAWQRIFFIELDGPRTGRQVMVTVVGE